MNNSELLIYESAHGHIKIDVRLEDDTVWLTQANICDLFQKSKATISQHIKNVFEEGELDKKVVVRKCRTTTQHGAITGKTQNKNVNFYNLDVIISVGYRVKSHQGTKFRIWATQRLREYIVKGFTLNDDRFKSGNSMNYFIELLDHAGKISHKRALEKSSDEYDKYKDNLIKFQYKESLKELENDMKSLRKGKIPGGADE